MVASGVRDRVTMVHNGTLAVAKEVSTATTLVKGAPSDASSSNGVLGSNRWMPARTKPRTLSFRSGIGPSRAAPLLSKWIRMTLVDCDRRNKSATRATTKIAPATRLIHTKGRCSNLLTLVKSGDRVYQRTNLTGRKQLRFTRNLIHRLTEVFNHQEHSQDVRIR